MICDNCVYEITCQLIDFHKVDSGGKCFWFADRNILKSPSEVLEEKREKALESLNNNNLDSKLKQALEKLNGGTNGSKI